jgi:hypothetical protein
MQRKKPWSALCTISNIGHLQCPIYKIYGEGIVGIKVVIVFMVDMGSSRLHHYATGYGTYIHTYMKLKAFAYFTSPR